MDFNKEVKLVAENDDAVTSGQVEGSEEEAMELSLRPQTLDQYLGQERVKKKCPFILKPQNNVMRH